MVVPTPGTTYCVGDSGPSAVDQRAVVDTSYLELVRLGVKPANDPYIVQSLDVVDDELGSTTPNGTFWHRYNFDGYGEQPDGSPWDIGFPRAASAPAPNPRPPLAVSGRSSPASAASTSWPRVGSAAGRLESMAEAGSPGYMLPTQLPPDGKRRSVWGGTGSIVELVRGFHVRFDRHSFWTETSPSSAC